MLEWHPFLQVKTGKNNDARCLPEGSPARFLPKLFIGHRQVVSKAAETAFSAKRRHFSETSMPESLPVSLLPNSHPWLTH